MKPPDTPRPTHTHPTGPQPFSVLGSTGSIGTQTLDIIAEFPDKFKLVALSAGSNVELLAQQVRAAGASRRLPGVGAGCGEGSRGGTALALPGGYVVGALECRAAGWASRSVPCSRAAEQWQE